MRHKITTHRLTEQQKILLEAALPEEYELTTAESVTDLIVIDAVCTVIDATNTGEDALRVLLAYYMDVGDQLSETVVWLGDVELPDLSSFVRCDSFLDMMTELESLLTRAQVRYETMQMYGGEYAYLPKHAIEESIEADINTALHCKYGNNPDPLIVKRMRQELTALREVNGLPDLAAAYELSRWLKKKNIPFFVEHVTASGLIPYLLGITQTNPLLPHTFCPVCKKLIWNHTCKDGFDIPAAVCADCGTALIRDGHGLIWQEYAGYGRVPTYGFWLPDSVRGQIRSWWKNHWLQQEWGAVWESEQPANCRIEVGPFFFIFMLEEERLTHSPDLQQTNIALPDEIFREDVFHYLCKHGFSEKDAFRSMNYVWKGKGFPVITEQMRTAKDCWFLNQCEAVDWLPSKAATLERLLFQSRINPKP